MFRHTIIKCCHAYRLPKNGLFKIYLSPIGRQHQRGTGTSRDLKPCPPAKSKKRYVFYSTGVLLVGAAGVIGYAKYDPEFRTLLTENIPWSDNVIQFVFEEQKSYMENINDMIAYGQNRVNQIFSNLFGGSIEWMQPTDKKKDKSDKKQDKETEKSGPSSESAASSVEKVETDQVKGAKSAAQDLITAINILKEAIKDQARSVSKLVDESVRGEDSSLASKIESIDEAKQKFIDEAEKKLQTAKAEFEKKRNQVASQSSIKATVDEVIAAMKSLDLEKSCLTAALKFANDFDQSRNRVKTELKTLFPDLNIGEKGSTLTVAELDLFILYAYNVILNTQQEIKKFDSNRDAKLREIVERSNTNVDEINERIVKELENEKIKFGEAFEKRKAEILANCEAEIMEQFKRQTKAHHAVLEEALEDKEAEVEKKVVGELQRQYEDEKKKYDSSLMGMISRMNMLNEAVQNRMKQEKKADQARELWAKCDALSNALRTAKGGTTEIKPLKNHISEIQEAAVKGDEFVDSIIASIPRKALCRGVFSEDMLRDRFDNVMRVAKRVAQVPEGGTSLPLTFLAFLQSLIVVQANEPIPSHELANQPIDTSTLNNFEILERARYWLERGDLEQSLRYMNLLQGGARAIAKDWMEETRILLETQQAANVLKSYATASSLIYM